MSGQKVPSTALPNEPVPPVMRNVLSLKSDIFSLRTAVFRHADPFQADCLCGSATRSHTMGALSGILLAANCV